jgi:ABC-type sugar transport system ATPase subunit
MSEAKPPVLRVTSVAKNYGQVRALADASLTVNRGEVHALLGDNGAGKSTLVKILSGAVTPTSGAIEMYGVPLTITGPRDVQRAGIETVFQDLALAPNLDPGENIFLGREILRAGLLGKLGFVDRREMRRRSAIELDRLGATFPSMTAEVSSMSGGQRQAVAVARAAIWGRSLLIMDEPTAALGVKQTAQVLELIRTIRASGKTSILLISHNLHDVFEVADRVTVLRLGRTIFEAPIGDTSIEELTLIMAGVGDAR